MKKLAIWGKEGFTPQPGASFLLPDPTFEAEFCPKPSSSSSSRGLSRSSSRPKTAPTGPAHSAFSPFRKQSTDQNSPTTPPQPTAPEPILTLRLSSISFLDSVVHDGTSDNPLYVIETDANHTKIRRSDPKGFINVARVRWREDTNYFARSKKELNGIMLAFGKGQWKPADEFLGYSYSSLSSYLKFYLPHHPHSLRWKRVGSAYQCTTQTVKGPIAILESPYALAPPMLKIFDPIFPEDTSRLQHMHAGVPMSLLDFLLVTSMLLLTEHDEWTNITRASAPSSSHADRMSSSSAAEPLSSLNAEVSSLSISDASSARSAGVYSSPNSRSTPVTVPSPADHEPQDVPLPSSYPTSPPPHPIHRSRSRLSGLSHSASRTSLTSASTSAESAGLIRPRASGGIERWRAAVHPPLPLPSPEIPDPVTRPASSRSRSSADSDQSSPLGSRFSHRVSSSLSHSAHTRELPMPPVPVPPLARPPPPPPPSVLDAPPARHGSLDSPMTRAPSSLPPLAVRSQTLPPPATSSGLTHAPPPTPARALPPVPIPQLQSPPRSQFQAQSQAPTPLPGKRSHVPPPLPQTRNGSMSHQQQRVPGSEVRFKTPPVYEPAEESGSAAAASSGGVSIGVGVGVGVGIGGVGVDTVGAYDAPPPAYSQHDFERSPFGPGRAAAAGGGDV